MTISQFCETMMLICFGFSWPASVVKSYKARTAKGKSLLFLCVIITGYIFGIIGKFTSGNPLNYVVILYFVNLCIVSCDLVLYFRNKHLDDIADGKK